MPKMKTRKSAAKRFRTTGSGKLMRRGKGLSHLQEHLSSTQKRRRHRDQMVSKADQNNAKTMLPYG